MNKDNLEPTGILDYQNPEVQRVSATLDRSSLSDHAFVQKAHGYISRTLRAVYSIEETMPVSRLLHLNQGSCSQRMACLEALARAHGIATRVCALWLDRTFWFSRLPLLRPLLPRKGILMPWPQFWIDGEWLDFDEIYGSVAELAAHAPHAFTNHGESMFDAVQHVPVDFFGKSEQCGDPTFSLARVVTANNGYFDVRDELLKELDRRSWVARIIFKLTYENKPVRRLPE